LSNPIRKIEKRLTDSELDKKISELYKSEKILKTRKHWL
jgi:hypothetical protein